MTNQTQPDHELLRAFASRGSQAAFRELTERYSGLVYAAAYRRTGQRGLAEEVAQNVFAVLARKATALARPDLKLAAWLHRATVLEAARARRKESIRQRIMDDYFHQADVLASEAGAPWQAVLPELDAALDALPGRDRELLLARFFEDRSYREIAAATGRSEAALMQQQHRALEKLSARLGQRGVAVPAAALASGLGGSLTEAAPLGLAASLASTAPAAAGSLHWVPLVLHSVDTFMQTKSRITVAAAIAACLLGGVSSFWVGQSRAAARGEALIAAAQADRSRQSAGLDRPAEATGGLAASAPSAALGIREKLEQAIAEWRSRTEYTERMRALEIIDRLEADDVPIALEVWGTVKGDYGLSLALGKHLAVLWGQQTPQPALAWISRELPREHRGEPMQAILTEWSLREPQAALAWWQGVMESLEFPIPEDAFERFESIIFTGWASNDPAGLAATLPEISDSKLVDAFHESPADARVLGLATAAVNPRTRDAVLSAIAAIPSEATRAAVAVRTAVMMNVADAEASLQFLTSLPLSNPVLRGDALGSVALMGVMMQQQSPAEAVAWLREQTDDANARRAVERFLQSYAGEVDDDLPTQLRTALESR
ncbi:MAG: RNA polymerase sigma factor [Verrucomicrobiales bacterium]